jgi:chitodextrinase/predicted esterase
MRRLLVVFLVACDPAMEQTTLGEICHNLTDDDGDGLADCRDADCKDDALCDADVSLPYWSNTDGGTVDDLLVASEVTATTLVLTWSGAADERSVDHYVVTQDGVSIGEATATTFAVSALSEATRYVFKVEAVDPAGNQSTSGPRLAVRTVDVTAPTWSNAGLRASRIGAHDATLTWSGATDNLGVSAYNVYAGDVLRESTADDTIALAELDEYTEYSIRVEAVDADGNESDSGPGLTVRTRDATAPRWSDGARLEADAAGVDVLLSWVHTDVTDAVGVVGYRVYQDGRQVAGPTTASYHLRGLTEGASYEFRMEAVDAAGNASSDGPTRGVRVGDFTAPTWARGSALTVRDNDTGHSFKVEWPEASDNVGVASYAVRLDGVLQTSGSARAALAADLYDATSYLVSVRATDAAGNVSEDLEQSFTTPDVTPPIWAPGMKLAASNVSDSSVDLTWSGAGDNGGVAGYFVSTHAGAAPTLIAEVSGSSYTASGLADGMRLEFGVEAFDAAGLVSLGGPRVIVTTNDSSPPTWNAAATLSTLEITASRVRLQWSEATDNVTVDQYVIYAAGEALGSVTGAATELTIHALADETLYNFQVVALDAAGNAANGPTRAVTTLHDAVAPTWTGATVTARSIGPFGVDLSWSPASDAEAVTGYRVYINEVLTAEPAGTTLELRSLARGQALAVAVQARDGAGNDSSDGPTMTLRLPDPAADFPPAALEVDCGAVDFALGSGVATLTASGIGRSARVLEPDEEGPRPLLLAFHGAGDSAANFASDASLFDFADAGFVVAVPESANQGAYWPTWDALRVPGNESPETDATADPNNDAAFATLLIACLAGELEIDARRVYVAGVGVGGAMAHYLAQRYGHAGGDFALAGAVIASGLFSMTSPAYGPDLDAPGGDIVMDSLFVVLHGGGADDRYECAGGDCGARIRIGFAEETARASRFYKNYGGSVSHLACVDSTAAHGWPDRNAWLIDVLPAMPRGLLQALADDDVDGEPLLPPSTCSREFATQPAGVAAVCGVTSNHCHEACSLFAACGVASETVRGTLASELGTLGFAGASLTNCSDCTARCSAWVAIDGKTAAIDAIAAADYACLGGLADAVTLAGVFDSACAGDDNYCSEVCTALQGNDVLFGLFHSCL